eukprot:1833495-Pyramimonas_sp.AAC.2
MPRTGHHPWSGPCGAVCSTTPYRNVDHAALRGGEQRLEHTNGSLCFLQGVQLTTWLLQEGLGLLDQARRACGSCDHRVAVGTTPLPITAFTLAEPLPRA